MSKNKQQSRMPTDLKRFWIIGAGRFGCIAVERIRKKIPRSAITVVDVQPPDTGYRGIDIILQDGIQWLKQELTPDAPVDIIVPAIPIHVAVEWIKIKLLKFYTIQTIHVPITLLAKLPNAIDGGPGKVYASHADFICPDNCPEPKAICTHTGKPRPRDLFRLLAEVDCEDIFPVVLRSHQLLPGVGGIYPEDLFAALEAVAKNSSQVLMIAQLLIRKKKEA
jgi:hypothetical protein